MAEQPSILKRLDVIIGKLQAVVDKYSSLETKEDVVSHRETNLNQSSSESQPQSQYAASYNDNTWMKHRALMVEAFKSNNLLKSIRPDHKIDLQIERPIGHTTHNLFCKEKSKKKKNNVKNCFFITHLQSKKCNLKTMSKILKSKELRLANNDICQSVFGFEKGCFTMTSILNIDMVKIQQENIILKWVVDEDLLKNKHESIEVCVGCNNALDHSQHHMIDITMEKVLQMVEKHCDKALEIIPVKF